MRYKVTNLNANEQYKTLVDIGQQCFVKAVVDAPQNGVYVHMGLGFFAELSWSDAADIALKREELLTRKVLQTQIAIDSIQADVDEVYVVAWSNWYQKHLLLYWNQFLKISFLLDASYTCWWFGSTSIVVIINYLYYLSKIDHREFNFRILCIYFICLFRLCRLISNLKNWPMLCSEDTAFRGNVSNPPASVSTRQWSGPALCLSVRPPCTLRNGTSHLRHIVWDEVLFKYFNYLSNFMDDYFSSRKVTFLSEGIDYTSDDFCRWILLYLQNQAYHGINFMLNFDNSEVLLWL